MVKNLNRIITFFDKIVEKVVQLSNRVMSVFYNQLILLLFYLASFLLLFRAGRVY